jgi:hypothetical protein
LHNPVAAGFRDPQARLFNPPGQHPARTHCRRPGARHLGKHVDLEAERKQQDIGAPVVAGGQGRRETEARRRTSLRSTFTRPRSVFAVSGSRLSK